MTAFICLLRGVNVGGNKMLKMESLKKLFSSLGLDDVSTYLQSGNVVFRSDVTDRAVLVRKIEEAIRKATALDVRIILRTAAEMKKVMYEDVGIFRSETGEITIDAPADKMILDTPRTADQAQRQLEDVCRWRRAVRPAPAPAGPSERRLLLGTGD